MRIIIFLFGTFFWLALFQMEAIPTDETVTVVLRAPTSKEPQLVVKPSDTEVDNSRRGLTVSLPINTPIFFCIDQVNTAIYTVEIKVTEEQPEVAKLPEFKNLSISTILNVIDTLLNLSQKQGLVEEHREGLKTLKTKVEAVDRLNKDLDALLYKTEDPKFYTTEGINDYFKDIQFKAAESTQKMLKCLEKDKSEEDKSKLIHGRSQEIYNAAGPVFTEFREEHQKLSAEHQKLSAEHQELSAEHQELSAEHQKLSAELLQSLSDCSNEMVIVLHTLTQKLRAIETATWMKCDTETRLLKNKIKYTCVFTPKMEDARVNPLTREVTVEGVATGWVIKTTQGVFISNLIDKNKKDDQYDFNVSLGSIIHLSRSSWQVRSVSGGVSVGLGVDGGQRMRIPLGFSIFISTDEEKAAAISLGVIVGKAESNATSPQLGNRAGVFGAITYNFNSIFGTKLGSNLDGD